MWDGVGRDGNETSVNIHYYIVTILELCKCCIFIKQFNKKNKALHKN